MDKETGKEIFTFRMEISGLVQGVGFRPFIYRLAESHGIMGWVENRNDGVVILFNHTREGAEQFKDEVVIEAPQAADIEEVQLRINRFREIDSFTIQKSQDVSGSITEISPDIGVCPACLDEMKSQPHRLDYPFINCTHCGPRFSIITDLPYDRPNTTMETFSMCPDCESEYNDIRDRRFHAQPVACNNCGPSYTLHTGEGTVGDLGKLLAHIRRDLSIGHIYALKGMGGYHLLCDAFNESAVSKLRSIKQRDGKPFALMFHNIMEARMFTEIGEKEEELLSSWRKPIVLLKRIKPITRGIADDLSTLGIMLPYMPFHYLLFEALDTPAVVLTSGNYADEPIIISNKDAMEQLGTKVDGIITHNREIFNRNDDSVSMVVNQRPQILRRSRGFAPSPIRTKLRTEGVFAAGAELTNSFCMGRGSHAMMSQYLGDLKNFESLRFYEEAYQRFSRMFRFSPDLIVHDLHPDYLSTKFASDLSDKLGGVPRIAIQHHHAHVASVMMDQDLDGEVMGFSFDGMGLGDDGHIWGAEVMLTDYQDYKRLYHFEYVPLPGGDRANKEPWRMAISYLYHSFGDEFTEMPLPVLVDTDSSRVSNIRQMIDQSLNTPLISSAGRLFDAVAAILGINYTATYQAEAPMRLESVADSAETGTYSYEILDDQVSFKTMIRNIVHDTLEGSSAASIAGKFHNTLINMIVDLACRIRQQYQINRIVLSGGTFQNRILTEKLLLRLGDEGFLVYLPEKVPVNDQGIALGQLAVGVAKKKIL